MSSTVLQASFREYFFPAPQVESLCEYNHSDALNQRMDGSSN